MNSTSRQTAIQNRPHTASKVTHVMRTSGGVIGWRSGSGSRCRPIEINLPSGEAFDVLTHVEEQLRPPGGGTARADQPVPAVAFRVMRNGLGHHFL